MSDILQVAAAERIDVDDRLVGDGITRYIRKGAIYSVYPPTAYLTFSNWIYMVPPFCPRDVLMLGYSGGTVAGLIRLLYGAVPIVAVDLEIVDNRYGVDLIQGDAREFVKLCRPFDCVVADLFDGFETPNFVSDDAEFVSNLARITEQFLIVHVASDADMTLYEERLDRVRMTDFGKFCNKVYYFKSKQAVRNFFPYDHTTT